MDIDLTMIIASHLAVPSNYSFSSAKIHSADSNEQVEKPPDTADEPKETSSIKG